MLYRCADKENKNVILVEDFNIFLNTIKLALSDNEIKNIIKIFDNESIIKKDDYF